MFWEGDLALGIQHSMLMRHFAMCSLRDFTVLSTLFHKQHDFKKDTLLYLKCLFWLLLENFSETFLILMRTKRGMINNFIGLQVKYSLFLSDFKETWIARQI